MYKHILRSYFLGLLIVLFETAAEKSTDNIDVEKVNFHFFIIFLYYNSTILLDAFYTTITFCESVLKLFAKDRLSRITSSFLNGQRKKKVKEGTRAANIEL